MNNSFEFWRRWLIVVSCGVLVFGFGLMLLPDLTQQFFNWMILSASQSHRTFNEAATAYITFVYGVLGAVIVGWSVALLLTLASSFRRREREGWNTLAASVGTWFVVDSTYSLVSGFWQNAVFNVVFFVCFAIPLAATYSHFEKKVE